MKLDPYVPPGTPLEPEVVMAMLDLSALKRGETHLELGAGDGKFVVEASKRGAKSTGYEIDAVLAKKAQDAGINVVLADCFNVDVSRADVVTFWFTVEPGTSLLMAKLRNEMKRGARLVCLYNSVGTGKARVAATASAWEPSQTVVVLGNTILLYRA